MHATWEGPTGERLPCCQLESPHVMGRVKMAAVKSVLNSSTRQTCSCCAELSGTV